MFTLTVRGSTLVVRSESDVYRRQILTTKVDPRTERVKQANRGGGGVYTLLSTMHEHNRV